MSIRKTRPHTQKLPESVRYIGSGEHKRYPNPLCPPGLRTDASDCDAVDVSISQDICRLQTWLETAIGRGQVDRVLEGRYPRKAWGWILVGEPPRRLLVEARLTNSERGEYKGYFIELSDLAGKRAWARARLDKGGDWQEVLR